jgi:hypothetical protein
METAMTEAATAFASHFNTATEVREEPAKAKEGILTLQIKVIVPAITLIQADSLYHSNL